MNKKRAKRIRKLLKSGEELTTTRIADALFPGTTIRLALQNLADVLKEQENYIEQLEQGCREDAAKVFEYTRKISLLKDDLQVTQDARAEALEFVREQVVYSKDKLIAIQIGHTYYGKDGQAWIVKALAPGHKYDVYAVSENWPDGAHAKAQALKGKWLSVSKPDSWERIIGDARKGYRFTPKPVITEHYSNSELIARCKKLAGETK